MTWWGSLVRVQSRLPITAVCQRLTKNDKLSLGFLYHCGKTVTRLAVRACVIAAVQNQRQCWQLLHNPGRCSVDRWVYPYTIVIDAQSPSSWDTFSDGSFCTLTCLCVAQIVPLRNQLSCAAYAFLIRLSTCLMDSIYRKRDTDQAEL